MKNFISFPHYDNLGDLHKNTFYHLIKNTSQEYKDELHDIYFGKFFKYNYKGHEKKYGNAMGLEATDHQIDNLFKLKDEFGIEPSLTLNSLETPHELLDSELLINQLVDFIGSYYKRGLRSCIMASNHLIRSGILHKNFPEMRWKSTVNQKCPDAQSVLDLLFNGYDTIMLDRRLNRNVKELKRIKKAVDYYNEKYKPSKKALTCLLVTESCVYNCPFKKEHDSVGEYISGEYFRTLSKMTCDNWRHSYYGQIPRSGIDVVCNNNETFNQYYENVDILKFSGRFTNIGNIDEKNLDTMKMAWLNFTYGQSTNKFNQPFGSVFDTVYSNTYTEIVEKNLSPIHSWIHGWVNTSIIPQDYNSNLNMIRGYNSIWSSEEGKKLEKLLMNCKSQCWDCHECENVFGLDHIDSVLQL